MKNLNLSLFKGSKREQVHEANRFSFFFKGVERICPLLLLVFFWAGCSSSVEMKYYSIVHPGKEASDTPARIPLSIAVENFRSEPSVRRQEIILRDRKEAGLALSSSHLWWTLPEEIVTEYVKNYLRKHNVFRHVFSYPTSHPVHYCLEGMLMKFEIETYPQEWKACLALQVYLVEPTRNDVLWDSGVVEASFSSLPGLENAVKKMEACLQEVCRTVGEGLEKNLSNKMEK